MRAVAGTSGQDSCPEAEWRSGNLHGSCKGQVFAGGEGRKDILGPDSGSDRVHPHQIRIQSPFRSYEQVSKHTAGGIPSSLFHRMLISFELLTHVHRHWIDSVAGCAASPPAMTQRSTSASRMPTSSMSLMWSSCRTSRPRSMQRR